MNVIFSLCKCRLIGVSQTGVPVWLRTVPMIQWCLSRSLQQSSQPAAALTETVVIILKVTLVFQVKISNEGWIVDFVQSLKVS